MDRITSTFDKRSNSELRHTPLYTQSFSGGSRHCPLGARIQLAVMRAGWKGHTHLLDTRHQPQALRLLLLVLCCLSLGAGGTAHFLRAAVDGEFWFLQKEKGCV